METTITGWIAVTDKPRPDENVRVLTFFPLYKKTDPLRHRIIEAQFLRYCKDITHWQYLTEPQLQPPIYTITAL